MEKKRLIEKGDADKAVAASQLSPSVDGDNGTATAVKVTETEVSYAAPIGKRPVDLNDWIFDDDEDDLV